VARMNIRKDIILTMSVNHAHEHAHEYAGGTASPNTTPRIRRPTLRCTAHTSCSPTALSRSTSRRSNKCLCSTNPTPRKILRADPGLQPAPGEWEIENPHHLNPSSLRYWGAT
jgi:hypothetical protein